MQSLLWHIPFFQVLTQPCIDPGHPHTLWCAHSRQNFSSCASDRAIYIYLHRKSFCRTGRAVCLVVACSGRDKLLLGQGLCKCGFATTGRRSAFWMRFQKVVRGIVYLIWKLLKYKITLYSLFCRSSIRNFVNFVNFVNGKIKKIPIFII